MVRPMDDDTDNRLMPAAKHPPMLPRSASFVANAEKKPRMEDAAHHDHHAHEISEGLAEQMAEVERLLPCNLPVAELRRLLDEVQQMRQAFDRADAPAILSLLGGEAAAYLDRYAAALEAAALELGELGLVSIKSGYPVGLVFTLAEQLSEEAARRAGAPIEARTIATFLNRTVHLPCQLPEHSEHRIRLCPRMEAALARYVERNARAGLINALRVAGPQAPAGYAVFYLMELLGYSMKVRLPVALIAALGMGVVAMLWTTRPAREAREAQELEDAFAADLGLRGAGPRGPDTPGALVPGAERPVRDQT